MAELPSAADYFAQAAHNEQVLDALLKMLVPQQPGYADWALVVAFYAGLHYAGGALLKDHNERPVRHATHRDPATGGLIRGRADLVSFHYGKDAAVAYHALYDLGTQARYQPLYRTFVDSRDTLNTLNLHRFNLETLKTHCHP